ncbi:MAG: HAMP domain-containing histidine kinase [Anaerolineae bacterium]|nr:HAMP domain-containing histidine kinase [Anaerolineae bacterium]
MSTIENRMAAPQPPPINTIQSVYQRARSRLTAWLRPGQDYPEHLAEKRQDAMIGDLRKVLAVTNELIACPNLDTTYRQAVEAIRDALGVERCAVFIAHDGYLHGTYGTDMYRRTTDEHTNSFLMNEEWQQRFERLKPQDAQWIVTHEEQRNWNGEETIGVGPGWIAITPIWAVGGFKGVLFNDTAISHSPLDPVQQEIVSVFCSLLGRIIETKETEEDLRSALASEKELGELKSRFISTISHEFRTPLAVIQSSAELLKHYSDRMDEEKKRSHLDKIEDHIQEMTNLLTNVLTISRSETVGLRYNPVALNIVGFCATLADEIRLTSGKAHEIVFNAAGAYSTYPADEKLLRQIITNLLTNAVKYSLPESTIELRLNCEADRVIITVRDEGIGIPEADLKHLFQDFYRAKNVEAIPGTGLGLSIVDRAVRAHGGSIDVASVIEEGTTFTVTLPIAASSTDSIPAAS